MTRSITVRDIPAEAADELSARYAVRVWELRDTVTAYDAWYVALAESLHAELVTLDRRLTRASGCRCGFRTPDV